MLVMFSGSRYASAEMLAEAERLTKRAVKAGHRILVGDAPGIDKAVMDAGGEAVKVFGAHGKCRNTGTGLNHPTALAYAARDEWLISQADFVVCLWNGKSRGTRTVFEKAKKKGKPANLKTFK